MIANPTRDENARRHPLTSTALGLKIGLAAALHFASLPSLADPASATATARAASVAEATALFTDAFVAAAKDRIKHDVTYDGRYLRLDYPLGDVPSSMGVCTDVVIRAYRAVGIDLQQAVHEDMKANFETYPTNWGLTRTDSNIDHRRVPNLRVYLERHAESLPLTRSAKDFRAGDLVTWRLGVRLPHIGIVVDDRSRDGRRPLIVHNVGRGPKQEDVLFDYPMTGHYRFLLPSARNMSDAVSN